MDKGCYRLCVPADLSIHFAHKNQLPKPTDSRFGHSNVRNEPTNGHLSPLLSPVPHDCPGKGLAPGGGIEPPLTDSKSAVLPLDDPGMYEGNPKFPDFYPRSAPCPPRKPPKRLYNQPFCPQVSHTVACLVRYTQTSTQWKSMNTTNEWLTASEAALEVRVSRATLYRYWSLGNGPRYSQLGARRLVRRAWLTDWLLEKEAA